MSFFLFVIAALLAAAAVWWLQRQQQRGRKEAVKLSRELPPLSAIQMPDFSAAPLTPTAQPVIAQPAVESKPTEPASSSWQDQVKDMKDRNELEAALSLCQLHFPRAQAFQQGAIVLRLQMKQQLEQKQDIASLLAKLYRCAVLADLFRSGTALRTQNPRGALKQLASVEFDYQNIGHQHLRLLSKSDIRLLEQRWGEPTTHCHAEIALGSLWDKLCYPLA